MFTSTARMSRLTEPGPLTANREDSSSPAIGRDDSSVSRRDIEWDRRRPLGTQGNGSEEPARSIIGQSTFTSGIISRHSSASLQSLHDPSRNYQNQSRRIQGAETASISTNSSSSSSGRQDYMQPGRKLVSSAQTSRFFNNQDLTGVSTSGNASPNFDVYHRHLDSDRNGSAEIGYDDEFGAGRAEDNFLMYRAPAAVSGENSNESLTPNEGQNGAWNHSSAASANRLHLVNRRNKREVDQQVGLGSRRSYDTMPIMPSTLPTARINAPEDTVFPSSRRWFVLFLFLQSLSIWPALYGFFYSAHRFYFAPVTLHHSSSTWEESGRSIGVTESRSTKLDWFISGLWALACAYFSHSLAKGLLRRWLIYYSFLPTIVRVISLQAICWPLTLTTHRILSFDQPVAGWLVCATSAAISNVVQIWVTSNIVERKDRRGHQRWKVLSAIISAVVGPGVRSEKVRKSDRALSWKRVLWGTVVPFAILGWITTVALLFQQFQARYRGEGGVSLYASKVDSALMRGTGKNSSLDALIGYNRSRLPDLDHSAKVRVVVLVTSSWTNRSRTNRDLFRKSSVLLFPQSDPSFSIAYRFLVGLAPSPQTAAKLGPSLTAEADMYKDILVLPAHDTYNELSKKIFQGWKWAAELQDVDYVFKTDDDVFLRMDTLKKEFVDLGRRKEYWKGFSYWEIPAIKDASNKNADFRYDLSSFPPYTAGALHILSHDLVKIVAPPTTSRLFVMNEDQNLGLWLYPTGIRPIHDFRIQQAQVCENDMIAKHFGGQYNEEKGIGPLEMYANVVKGKKMCDGFLQKWCGVCYPSCRNRENHWRDWGFTCDSVKGATLSNKPSNTLSQISQPLKAIAEPYVIGSADDPWIVPGILSRYTSPFSSSDDWHLLHMLCWTTGPETFQERHYQALETIWAHEPKAILFMMSTNLPFDFFEESYTKYGYAIHVVRIGGAEMLEMGWYLGDESQKWLREWDRWSKGRNFYSHLTDYLRYLFLFKYGGTYLDMDAPWVRSPPDSDLEFIGADYSTMASDQDWTLDEEGMYLAPGVMRFRKGWVLFREILEHAFSPLTYQIDCFNCVGPRAITTGVKGHRRDLELNGFTILPNTILYPKNWITSHELVKPLPFGEGKKELAKIVQGSWSIHLFGKMTNHLRIQSGSIIASAFEEFTLDIPRKAGYQSSMDTDLGDVSKLGLGLALRLPSSPYVYRSRLNMQKKEEPQLQFMGSLDGRFDGLDLIMVTGAKSAIVDRAIIHIRTSTGGKILLPSSSARKPGFSLEPNSTLNAAPGGAKELVWTIEKASFRDVNALLGSIVYGPSNKWAIVPQKDGREIDEVSIVVQFGEERVAGSFKIVLSS